MIIDITKNKEIQVCKKIDPKTFLLDLGIGTEEGEFIHLRLSFEQQRTLQAKLLGVNEDKVEAFYKLTGNKEYE